MLKKLFATLVIVISFLQIIAQDYVPFLIPENLSKNADAVVQFEDYSIDLVSQDKMLIHHKAAITIFNKNADYLADLTLYYDKHNYIKSVNMEFYNSFGKSIKKVKKKDFDDYSATGNTNLYTDNRVIHYDYIAISYPYTVVYEYKKHHKYTAFIPEWNPINNYNVGVKKSSYSFTYPPNFKIQKLESNFDKYSIQKNISSGLLKYSISNLDPLKYEAMSQGLSKITPNVKLASNRFHLAGVDGTADNWKDFGKWMYNELLASRNNLSEETITKVKKMVKDVSDPIERAKIIYEYVQNKTRYISVQVEIGGWQPMMTDDVDRLGYGDCKALTFYTKSLMDVAEVSSFYTSVYSGNEKRSYKKDVVCKQGDHIILCLPATKDTIWLECTSQKIPFGSRNSFTDDRDVLAITKEGGKIIHTNTYKPERNLQETIATYSINSDGGIQADAEIKSYGTQYVNHLFSFDGLSPKDLEKEMKDYFDFINNLNFSKIEVTNNKESKRYEESVSFSADNYTVTNSDGSMLLTLNAFNRIDVIPKRAKNRKTPFEIARGYQNKDTYTINIPQNYLLFDLPKPITIENKFGTYFLSVEKLSETSLLYKRIFLLNKGLYPKEQYDSYRKFRKQIKKYEKLKIILKKQ
jgi:hypothetical protein